MGARHFRDLAAWQLANELRREIIKLTAIGRSARDFRFRDQIRDASASVSRNIAEGFGRFGHKEFARYLGIALGSLSETQNHLIDALDREYLGRSDFDRLWTLSLRTAKATTKLLTYLRRNPDP